MVVDDREAQVLPFIQTYFGQEASHYIKKRIEYGDYLLCQDSAVLACFERKTLKDFASSLRDGRMENKKKMFHLRDQTGCQLYYIIEGTAFAEPSWAFTKGMTYQTIRTSMITMPLRDGIHIIQSKNEEYTAQLLASITKQANRVESVYMYPKTQEGEITEVAPGELPAIVTAGYQVSDEEYAIKMWASLPGVSPSVAKILVDNVSVMEVATNTAVWEGLRTASGRMFVKKARESLTALTHRNVFIHTKILSGINGITVNIAGQLLAVGPILYLAQAPESVLEDIQIISQSGNFGRLGPAKASKIHKMLNFKNPQTAVLPPAPVQTVRRPNALDQFANLKILDDC